jgi:hypothetical protein
MRIVCALLALLLLAVFPFSLLGCAGQSAQQVVTTAAQDMATVASGLDGALSGLAGLNIKGLTPDKVQKVQAAIADLKTAATALAQASSAGAAQPIVQQVEGDVNAIVTALAGITWPPEQKTIATALDAAQVLLPVIESAVGMVLPPAAAPKAAAALSPDQARAILLGAAAR